VTGDGRRAPGPTLDASLELGPVARTGTLAAYHRLALAPGAARVRRDELGTGGGRDRSSRSLLYLAHLTDLQLADVASPGRFEFMEAFAGLPAARDLVPAQRPQEAFSSHAASELVRAIGRRAESPDTGAPLGLAVSTGDNIDNAQWNELAWYLTLLSGGVVSPGAGRPYEGVQRPEWPGHLYWRPDAAAGRFQSELGFPTLPGVLDDAMAAFTTPGLTVPWVSCFGNHDGLPFGEVVPTGGYRAVLTGGRKAAALPPGLGVLGHADDLYRAPERYLAGPWLPVAPDAGRTVVGRREFVAAHLAAPGSPRGHGFSPENLEADTAYAALDVGAHVRLLLLDTTNLDGDPHGSIGARQLRWLEEQLVAVHSGHLAADGRRTTAGSEDRLVVLASHHGLATLTNLRRIEGGLEPDQPRAGRDEVRRLLHRFPNVVLWLNGHRHVNEVAVRSAPGGDSAFVEVATCSIADWPSQARLVELVSNADGTLSVLTEMVDHLAPADPAGATDAVARLGSLHREIAANAPPPVVRRTLEGRPDDRNVEVLLPAPIQDTAG
jgi:metallophosphoesterase (TIGR03767 family)